MPEMAADDDDAQLKGGSPDEFMDLRKIYRPKATPAEASARAVERAVQKQGYSDMEDANEISDAVPRAKSRKGDREPFGLSKLPGG